MCHIIGCVVCLPTDVRVSVEQGVLDDGSHYALVQFPKAAGKVAESENGVTPYGGVPMARQLDASFLCPLQILILHQDPDWDDIEFARIFSGNRSLRFLASGIWPLLIVKCLDPLP